MRGYLPEGVVLNTYSEHDTMIPYSPTTLKKDKNKLSNQTTGFIQIINGKLENIEYFLLADGVHYSKIVREDQNKKLVRKMHC